MMLIVQTEKMNTTIFDKGLADAKEVFPQADQHDEINRLKRLAVIVIIVLLLLLTGSIGFTVWGLAKVASVTPVQSIMLAGLCLAAGMAGSALSALNSVADRFSNGFELENGVKLPKDAAKQDMFGQRMIPWFLVRPFLGASMGLAVYLSLSAGLIGGVESIVTENAFEAGLRLTFFALLAGLFAKKFLDSLRKAFDAFVGSA